MEKEPQFSPEEEKEKVTRTILFWGEIQKGY